MREKGSAVDRMSKQEGESDEWVDKLNDLFAKFMTKKE